MILHETELSGCFVLEAHVFEDERGVFARTFCAEEFAEYGLNPAVAQCSVSYNISKGTLRGLHYQTVPYAEAKLVSCSKGRIFDVAVDLRLQSPTFSTWTAKELSASDQTAFYIPEGLAHGFVTLEPGSEVRYQISVPYEAGAARGIRWNDPAIAIEWPDVGPFTLSDRDGRFPTLAEFRAESTR